MFTCVHTAQLQRGKNTNDNEDQKDDVHVSIYPNFICVQNTFIVKLRLRLRLSGTQALRLSGSLRHTQAHSGSYSGSLRLLLSDSDSDPEPGLTLKSCRPPLPTTHHPTNFKHEGGVPHKNPKSKTD